MSGLDIEESSTLGDCIEVETTIQHGQHWPDDQQWPIHGIQEEEDAADRRNQGYASSEFSGATDGSDNRPNKRRRHSSGESDIFHGYFERCGTGNNNHTKLMAADIIPEFPKVLNRGQTRIVRESLTFSSSCNPFTKIEEIYRSLSKKGTVFAISRHDEPMLHFHVIHACPWKYYCCRCYTPSVRRRNCRTSELATFTVADWNRLFIYLSTEGRQLQYVCSGITLWRRLRGIQFFPDEGLLGLSRWEEPLENCDETTEDRPNTVSNDANQSGMQGNIGGNKKLKFATGKVRYEDLESMMMRFATVPLQSITHTRIWQGSSFRYIDVDNPKFKQVLNSLRKRISTWTFAEFRTHYENNDETIFEAIQKPFDEYYFTRYESYQVIKELVEFQYKDYAAAQGLSLYEGCKLFFQEVYDICEKSRAKVNTLEIIGPAGSGKSYFIDMICAFYLNVGHARNWNKNESFPLQSCNNRRIILWNEAQCEPSAHDTIKLLLGGDPCPANIKYMDTATIARTPLFITANKRLIPKSTPFQQRMIRYDWVAAPFLKDYKKKPHPLCLIDLYQEYDIIV
uniref:Nonstructural protein 1 n=1 Tax=Emberiza spodocephala parvoviridae sp. TaxID=2794481 RepID=A0A8A4XDM6_9VIRU|nr:MAG: nonstructural protein 1 [Emberiza spodocephala parvoviridae sp.]